MCKLTVIENNSIGFIFGLDNMRSHRCFIDLGKNLLTFPDSDIQVTFLSDGEVKQSRVEMEDDDLTDAQIESLNNKK
jgi:hypothetical protein